MTTATATTVGELFAAAVAEYEHRSVGRPAGGDEQVRPHCGIETRIRVPAGI